MKAGSGWIKKLKYMMIRFKKQWKELPAPIWLIFVPSVFVSELCACHSEKLSLLHITSSDFQVYAWSEGYRACRGRAERQLFSCYSVVYASTAQQAWACLLWSSNWALSHSVGGSGYGTKHSLTFLLKRVGSGFYIFFLYCRMLWGSPKGQVIVVDFCLPLW